MQFYEEKGKWEGSMTDKLTTVVGGVAQPRQEVAIYQPTVALPLLSC